MTSGAGPVWLDALVALPGRVGAEDLGRFVPPPGAVPRRSAVLLLFGGQAPAVLLTQRSATLRDHAGQVSFPGGALDPGDAGPVDAALREAREETGLDPAGVEVIGTLPDLYLPVSDFEVTPVLAWWRAPSPVAAIDPAEVSRVAVVPVAELTDPANRFLVRHPAGHAGPGFRAAGLFVWGFTGGLLDRLLELTGWARPWDASRVVRLPGGGAPPGFRRQEAAS